MTRAWSSPAMAQVAELVRERTGLVFPDSRVPDVEATIRRTMSLRGLTDVRKLVAVLLRDEAARESFVADLTIGETYFQRDPAQFELLRTRILPELLADRPPDQPVRAWSAGCASGEEPYSIALTFDALNVLDRADITGTDIARPRLEQAQRGLYSRWSLRGTPDDMRDRYFTPRGRYHELSARIRERVTFGYLNLAEDQFPSLTNGIWGMDVIFCRNVLIYFDTPVVEHVARRLIASLSENGWLIMGASDPAIRELIECDVIVTDAGLVYRRPGTVPVSRHSAVTYVAAPLLEPDRSPAPDDTVLPVPVLPDPTETIGAVEPERQPAAEAPAARAPLTGGALPDDSMIQAAYARRAFDLVGELAERASAGRALGADAWIAWVRALANRGCLAEADRVVQRAIAATPSAELLYLHAVLQLQAGHAAAAASAARRALYMDRDLVVAHLTLADAQLRTGNVAGARRALRNAASLLTTHPADGVVPASDGETAGRLAALVRVRLQLLDEAA